MKKSRIAKLSLMGASIAALAATLTTSTYAWYVTNQTATITAVTGSTASAASAGAISISTSGVKGTYKKQVALGNFSTASLLPVSTADGKTFYSLDESTDADSTAAGTQVACTTSATVAKVGYGASDAGSVYCYRFFMLAEGATTDDDSTSTVDESKTVVTPTITITNTTGTNNFKSQINYGAGALTPAGITSGTSFYANALNAMSISCATQQGSALVSTLADATAVTNAYSGATQLQSLNLLSESITTGNVLTSTENAYPTGALIATAGAKTYYEEISGKKLYDKTGSPKATVQYGATGNTSSASALGNITLDNMKPVLVEFYVWLDGADDACFNACEQQNFSVEFLFTVAA